MTSQNKTKLKLKKLLYVIDACISKNGWEYRLTLSNCSFNLSFSAFRVLTSVSKSLFFFVVSLVVDFKLFSTSVNLSWKIQSGIYNKYEIIKIWLVVLISHIRSKTALEIHQLDPFMRNWFMQKASLNANQFVEKYNKFYW